MTEQKINYPDGTYHRAYLASEVEEEVRKLKVEMEYLQAVADAASRWRIAMRDHGSDSNEFIDTYRELRNASYIYDFLYRDKRTDPR